MAAIEIQDVEKLREWVGREVAVSDWLEVSQARIDQFAEATGDRQWIHTDAERARRESPYGTTIAHGFLTLSLTSFLMAQTITFRRRPRMGINYGLNRVRFPAAVPSGARVRARLALRALEDVAGGVQATWGVSVECEGAEKPCCVAEWLVRYYQTSDT